MPDSLLDLERRRSQVLAEISELGDFRPGSISATSGRCGTPSCHCHQPDDPGHGPNSRLTYKVDGKTVTESFPSAAAQRKAEREVAGRVHEPVVVDGITDLAAHAGQGVELLHVVGGIAGSAQLGRDRD